MTSDSTPTSRDRTRQIVVTLAEIFCIVGTLVGVGVIGSRVAESSGGDLAADATLLAPAGPAFSIWSVIYVGLGAYTIWQWLPGRGTSALARRTGWWVAASMVLNAAWLLVTQQGWVWVSVIVIVALLAVLVRLAQTLQVMPASERDEQDRVGGLLTRATAGLYLGWVAIATFANVAAALASSGVDAAGETSGRSAEILAVLALVIVAVVVTALARFSAIRWGVVAAAVWGLGWLAWGRLTDEPSSTLVGVGAIVTAVVVLATAWRFHTVFTQSSAQKAS